MSVVGFQTDPFYVSRIEVKKRSISMLLAVDIPTSKDLESQWNDDIELRKRLQK